MHLPKLLLERYLRSPKVKVGRISEVFQGTDGHCPGKIVAIKVFKCGLYNDAVIQEAFERESRILTELRHESIIPLLDFGVEPTTRRPFLILEWGGKDLTESIDKSNIRDWDTFYDSFGKGILEALAYAHSRGVVHRDIKPADLLRGDDGRIRLADFGISRYRDFLDSTLDMRQFINEPFTPENGYDPNYSFASDVYGFGAIALDFLSAVPLKMWSDLRKALGQVEAPQEILDILEGAISIDPGVRPSDAQVLRADIERIQGIRRRGTARRQRCFFQLTVNALTALEKSEYLSQERDAQMLVTRELNADSYIRRYVRIRQDTGQREAVEGEYSICGSNLEFHAAVDRGTGTHLAILSARRPMSSIDLDRFREDGWRHPFEFKCGQHPSILEGRQILKDIKLGLDQFEQERSQKDAIKAEEDLFRAWSALIKARNELADSQQSVPYDERTIEGNRITFHTQQPFDPAAVEQFWEVPITPEFSLRGLVDNVDGDLTTLYVDGTVPKSLPNTGILRLDARSTRAALKREKDALDGVQFGNCVRSELKESILRPRSCVSNEPIAIDKWWFEDIDEDKKDAVKRALAARDFFVVHGPPGTGKTMFIVELALQFLGSNPGKRVLLTSQTHIGVDNAIERLVQASPALRVVRVGHQEAKVSSSVHKYLLQHKIQEWSKQVRERAEAFIEQWSSEHGVRINEVRLGMQLGRLIKLLRQKGEHEKTLSELRKSVTNPSGEFPVPVGEVIESPVLDRKNADNPELRERVEILQEYLQKARSEERRLRDELSQSGADGRALSNDPVDDLAAYQSQLIGRSDDVQKFRKLLELNLEWLERFGAGEDCLEAILTSQDVVAGTCIGIGGLTNESVGQFDLCILDEASKATATEALVPLVKSKKWILVGDTKQLPPYVDAALRDNGIADRFEIDPQSLRETLLLRMQSQLPASLQAQLSTQHRMVRAVGNLISHVFYDGMLNSVREELCPVLSQVLPKPVTWFSTSSCEGCGERNSGASFLNPMEAQEIVKIIERVESFAHALEAGRQGADSAGRMIKIAVLSGYSAQTSHIRDLLKQKRRDWLHVEVVCHTVDAFQGREADLAIFSVTRSNVYGRAGFLTSPERINVGLSRGKNGLCIVGDSEFCFTLRGCPLARVLDYLKANGDECCIRSVTK